MEHDDWPELHLSEWEPTYLTLHRWLQIVGKVRLALSPPANHWWHVALYVTPEGLTTSAVPFSGGCFAITFDFCALRSVLLCPGVRSPGSVRGALPKVNAGAAVNAAALIHPLSRSSVVPLVASATPGTMLGRCVLPNRPELLLACHTEMGKPF